jgi:hypothetical protein
MGNYLNDKPIGVHAKLDIKGIVTQQKYWYYYSYLFLHQFIIFEYLKYLLLIITINIFFSFIIIIYYLLFAICNKFLPQIGIFEDEESLFIY